MPDKEQELNEELETYNDILEEAAHAKLLSDFALMCECPPETKGICAAIEEYLK